MREKPILRGIGFFIFLDLFFRDVTRSANSSIVGFFRRIPLAGRFRFHELCVDVEMPDTCFSESVVLENVAPRWTFGNAFAAGGTVFFLAVPFRVTIRRSSIESVLCDIVKVAKVSNSDGISFLWAKMVAVDDVVTGRICGVNRVKQRWALLVHDVGKLISPYLVIARIHQP